MNKRYFVAKKEAYREEEKQLLQELQACFSDLGLHSLRRYEVYDIFGAEPKDLHILEQWILADPVQDILTSESPDEGHVSFAVAAKEGQFDQRSQVCETILRLHRPQHEVTVRTARLYIFQADCDQQTVRETLLGYLMNPVDQKEKDLSRLVQPEEGEPEPLRDYADFLELDTEGLARFLQEEGLAMTPEDLQLVQDEFRRYGRIPSEVEIKVLDTYWSDHCRHSTFLTELTEIENRSEAHAEALNQALDRYETLRAENQRTDQPRSLMDLATIVARDRRRRGLADRQEISDEINACSVHITADRAGEPEDWLLMFKNETHNHPTEIEPFGGAGTCLGGCIRDPLSGRAKVYQAVRITGAGDIRTPLSETVPHKLPQAYLSRTAAQGFSDYGNQIGVASTLCREIFHPGYVAKRMEMGALVAAAPRANVLRAEPRPGDRIVLLGEPTGRDGVGGATGSSRVQDKESAQRSGAEVQKGNPPAEGKIMRLFERPEIARLIRKCNDFGAGGVSVAVGELADSLDITLDYVPTKYAGLNALELAISESQERMAVLLAPEHVERFIEAAAEEDCAAVVIAEVTDSGYLRMRYRGETVFEIRRAFLNTNGAARYQKVLMEDPVSPPPAAPASLNRETLLRHLARINFGTQEGLTEQFDSSIGRTTVLMPAGGTYQQSEETASVHKLPIAEGTETVSAMTYGYSPELAVRSPYLMGAYSVVEALAKLTAAGLDYREAFLSNQEFFPSPGRSPERWGLVLAALLGLMEAQEAFGTPSIGGKDSMSGTFEDIDVPPTLFTFAVSCGSQRDVRSVSLPRKELRLFYLPHRPAADGRPDYERLKANFAAFLSLNARGVVLAASPLRQGGLAETLVKMATGNRTGIQVLATQEELFRADLGGLVFAVEPGTALQLPSGLEALELAKTLPDRPVIVWREGLETPLAELREAMSSAYAEVYPPVAEAETAPNEDEAEIENETVPLQCELHPVIGPKASEVRVLIPRFPGDNGADDLAAAFRATGAAVKVLTIRVPKPELQKADTESFLSELAAADIFAVASSYGFGDLPSGGGIFMANFLALPEVRRAFETFLQEDKLVLGIDDGFRALVRAGYLPGGSGACAAGDASGDAVGVGAEDGKQARLGFARNPLCRHVSRLVNSRVMSTLSPWTAAFEEGQVHSVPVSASQASLRMSPETFARLEANGQIAFRYADARGQVSEAPLWNPLGSVYAVEGILSADGKILGKTVHPERYVDGLWVNVPGDHDQHIFANGVAYIAARK